MLDKVAQDNILNSNWTFNPESDEFPHILSLCQAHADELRVFGILKLNLDVARYLELQSKNRLLCLVGRDGDNKIRAYSTHFIHKHPHYKMVWVGQEDSIYVEPSLRRHGIGRRLRETAETELKQRGCNLITSRTKFGHEDYTTLEELGFKRWEVSWAREL